MKLDQKEIERTSILKNINDKKSAGNVYFANGSFFICKRDVTNFIRRITFF